LLRLAPLNVSSRCIALGTILLKARKFTVLAFEDKALPDENASEHGGKCGRPPEASWSDGSSKVGFFYLIRIHWSPQNGIGLDKTTAET
jgi:hypothetical protein